MPNDRKRARSLTLPAERFRQQGEGRKREGKEKRGALREREAHKGLLLVS